MFLAICLQFLYCGGKGVGGGGSNTKDNLYNDMSLQNH